MANTGKSISQGLLPEFDQEMASTRKTLERVPEGAFSFKPHEKSFSMGDLATHLSNIPGWGTLTLTAESFDVAPGGQPVPQPAARSVKELLKNLDEGVGQARAALAAATDEQMLKGWSLLSNGAVIMTLPRIAVLRSFVMNHLIHHRAQLGLYLRMNGVPVPAIYGPSADENPM